MSPSARVLPILTVIALLLAACAQPVDGRPGTPAVSVSASPDPAAAAAPTATPAPVAAPAATQVPSPSAGATPPSTPVPSDRPVPSDPPAEAATPSPAPVAAKLEPHAFDLYRKGDFVAQYTFEWCVGASLQMMLNLAGADDTRSRARQEALWELARDLSSSPFGGANPRGWTAALNKLGVGSYKLVSIPDYDDALRVAAKALRKTKRPVGLVMWRGRHAWVMSGFTSVGDPRKNKGFRVTGIRVLDPLYPHGSSVWGASPRPNRLLSPKKLAEQFVIRDRSRVNLGVGPGHLLILPVT